MLLLLKITLQFVFWDLPQSSLGMYAPKNPHFFKADELPRTVQLSSEATAFGSWFDAIKYEPENPSTSVAN